MLAEHFEMQRDCFSNQFDDSIARLGGNTATRQVRNVRSPGIAFVLDYDSIVHFKPACFTIRLTGLY